MKPHRVIGFKATSRQGYDCSLMVMFPADAPVTEQDINQTCERAINDAAQMHGGVTVHGRVETVIMK